MTDIMDSQLSSTAQSFRERLVAIDQALAARIPDEALQHLALVADPQTTIHVDFDLNSVARGVTGWVAAVSTCGVHAHVKFENAGDPMFPNGARYAVAVRRLHITGLTINQDPMFSATGSLAPGSLTVHVVNQTGAPSIADIQRRPVLEGGKLIANLSALMV